VLGDAALLMSHMHAKCGGKQSDKIFFQLDEYLGGMFGFKEQNPDASDVEINTKHSKLARPVMGHNDFGSSATMLFVGDGAKFKTALTEVNPREWRPQALTAQCDGFSSLSAYNIGCVAACYLNMILAAKALDAIAFCAGNSAQELVKTYLLKGSPINLVLDQNPLLLNAEFDIMAEIPPPVDWDFAGTRAGVGADDVDFDKFLPATGEPADGQLHDDDAATQPDGS
jgi:hypothetical protein